MTENGAKFQADAVLGGSEIRLGLEAPDAPDANACRVAYFDELARRFPQGFDPEAAKASRDGDMLPPSGAFILARRDGVPVGCGGIARLDDEFAEVKRVWTAPEARGLGIARLVLHELERRAAAAGYRAVRLDTNSSLTEAHAFYRSEHYREIERYNDNPYAHLWFEKRLR